MSDRFYGCNLGAMQPIDVTEQATTTSKVIELRINSTVFNNKLLVQQALIAIANYLSTKENNPIG